jgi:hypothetical protein
MRGMDHSCRTEKKIIKNFRDIKDLALRIRFRFEPSSDFLYTTATKFLWGGFFLAGDGGWPYGSFIRKRPVEIQCRSGQLLGKYEDWIRPSRFF